MGECCCGNDGLKLIYSCSGAANTGFLADTISRQLMKSDIGKMTCLAGIGADLSGFIESAKSADKNILIDGCKVACAKKMFDKMNLSYVHYVMTDYNVEKGVTEITPEVIERVLFEVSKKERVDS